ncbi:MAG: flagellar type III secretion system pore protein FliP [Planctomycetales bacterium]|nr:flagellar type III secretion system pore protein FliP [Planctomycetales bacterium]
MSRSQSQTAQCLWFVTVMALIFASFSICAQADDGVDSVADGIEVTSDRNTAELSIVSPSDQVSTNDANVDEGLKSVDQQDLTTLVERVLREKSELTESLPISTERFHSSLQIMASMAAVSLIPAAVLMMTSYIRISIVLSLLRQALGTQNVPSTQVTTALSLLLTLLIMWPVGQEIQQNMTPLTSSNSELEWEPLWQASVQPIRRFMSIQIKKAGNDNDILLFLKHMPPNTPVPTHYDDVPLQVLFPAFIVSELKTAFFMGFQIYLPFLLVDAVVAAITMSMGMVMLPPAVISLPLKLILFVAVDGWHLVVEMLISSFGGML